MPILHHDGRHASRQSKQTLQTLTRQLDRETIMHETLQLLSAGPRRQASARTSAESDEACQRKTKDRADGMREKSAHCPRRDSNLYLWDTRPSCFRYCTTTAGTPPVSRNKHFRHSPASSIVKQSCMKHSNSYLCVCVCVWFGFKHRNTHTHAHTRTHKHTHTHTHTHTQAHKHMIKVARTSYFLTVNCLIFLHKSSL